MKSSLCVRALWTATVWCVAISTSGFAVAAEAGNQQKPAVPDKGAMALQPIPHAKFAFQGPLGQRINNNVDQWLLIAPESNPGMLDMFRVRDRKPVPQLVPWAGEFVGKYLLSAIPALRMTNDARLRSYVEHMIAALIETQAEDGYLGPFPAADRLRSNWDLWGHYHIMLALLMWNRETGDAKALDAAVRAADLVCKTYLNTDRRVIDAGSHEMNMAIIHSLGELYRLTGRENYLQMMREIEKDWEKAGDYVRTGASGMPFYQIPRPRWESLHDLQGIVELYRITGDPVYKKAFMNLWRGIAEFDRHPSGSFSTGEQAVGNPYQEGAIETCCTTAWCALSVDMLKLTGDPRVADELEISLWNSVLGSQHPCGRWWTYNTPVNGAREASAHTIVFQSRAGTPELNCCSVNAPRGIGFITEWGIVQDATGVLVNFYGPCQMTATLPNGSPLQLTQETSYPCDGKIAITLHVPEPSKFMLRLRVPQWSRKTEVKLNGENCSAPGTIQRGTYFAVERTWKNGDKLELNLDMTPRHWAGALARANRAALYAGPLLMTFDPHYNSMDTTDVPPIDVSKLQIEPATASNTQAPGSFSPIKMWKVATADGKSVVLCDFASAGAHGNDYAAWLPAINTDPTPPILSRPMSTQAVAPGAVLFVWRGRFGVNNDQRTFSLIVSRDAAGKDVVYKAEGLRDEMHLMKQDLDPGSCYYWSVTAHEQGRQRANDLGPRAFSFDKQLPNESEKLMQLYQLGPNGLITSSPLDGNGEPKFGLLGSATAIQPGADRFDRAGMAVQCDGEHSGITYRLAEFPKRDYTFYAWVRPGQPADNHLQQIVSAWRAGMDDPIRVCIHGKKLFARIEAGQVFGTKGTDVEPDKWIHVAVVKEGPALRLYVNGQLSDSAQVPEQLATSAADFALGMNPHFSIANEKLLGLLDDFAFYARAFPADEIKRVYEASVKPQP